MATYNFSTLSSGQAIAFDPAADVLFFDQSAIFAANLNYVSLTGAVRIAVRAGTDAGKYVDLVGASAVELAPANISFANGSRFHVGDGSIALNDDAANTVYAPGGNDFVNGAGGNDFLNSGSGNDWIEGATGSDTLTGSGGQDSFAFNEHGLGAGPDVLADFASGWDNLQFNVNIFDLGGVGRFSAGDARFWAAAGATAGHDADDRLIFNTTTRELWYDADGSGAGASLLVLRLSNTASISATDIWAFRPAGTDAPPPPPPPGEINGTEGNDSIVGTAGNDTINGLGGGDVLRGAGGDDRIDGGAGNDGLYGDAGNDTLIGATTDSLEIMDGGPGDDSLEGSSGNDDLYPGDGNDTVAAGDGDDAIWIGFNSPLVAAGLEYGNDVAWGGSGSNTLLVSMRSAVSVDTSIDLVSGGSQSGGGSVEFHDVDHFQFAGGFAVDFVSPFLPVSVTSGTGDDTLTGSYGDDFLDGGFGTNVLYGREGNDVLRGDGVNEFIFDVAPGPLNADTIFGWDTDSDSLHFDGDDFAALGGSGQFAVGDERFHLGTSAHDTTDRLIYDGLDLWYDPDGTGATAQVLVLRLDPTGAAAKSLAATDIHVFNGAEPPGPINGTAGNDSLAGTPGSDTMNGLGGNDTLFGGEGADSFSGGDGNDLLDARDHRHGDWDENAETMDGGLGNDTFHVDNPDDVIADAGGTDTIVAHNMDWTLGGGFENLVINNGQRESVVLGVGNALNNVLDGRSGGGMTTGGDGWHVRLEGLGGNDTVLGSSQDDVLLSGGEGNDSIDGDWDYDSLDGGAGNDTLDGGLDEHQDTISGGSGADVFLLAGPGSSFFIWDAFTDFASGVDRFHMDGEQFPGIGPSGGFAAADDRFVAAAAAQDAEDRVIWDGGALWYDEDGTGAEAMVQIADLQPGATVIATDIFVFNGTEPPPPPGTSDTIFGTSGNDTLSGGPGNDSVNGGSGNDWLLGGTGNDTLSGSGGQDAFVFGERGAADADRINDFASNWDSIRLDDVGFSSIGAAGRFSSGDARFWAAPGASQGHDASDRIVFDTTTKELWYDRDGLGGAGAELIATLQATANVAAGDIYVI